MKIGPFVVTIGGDRLVSIRALPTHVKQVMDENAKLLGSLSDAKDALRAEVDRRTTPSVAVGVPMPDRRRVVR